MTISLSSYIIRVKVKNKDKNTYAQIDSFDGKSDLLDEFKSYLSNLSTKSSLDEKQRKLIGVNKISSDSRLLNGIVETGEYGYESDLKNKDTGVISYTRKIDEAEMLPFYFLISVPKNAHEAILILQRFRQFGIRKYLLNDFNNYFASKYANFGIEINPLVPETLIQQYLDNGKVFKIRFIRNGVHEDLADAYDEQGEIELEGYTELVVSAKRNSRIPLLNTIRECLKGNKQLNKLVEIHDFDYDNVKVELVVNKKHRTINLGSLQRIRSNYDVTNLVKINQNGHPSFESIDSVGRDLLGDLSETVYGKPND